MVYKCRVYHLIFCGCMSSKCQCLGLLPSIVLLEMVCMFFIRLMSMFSLFVIFESSFLKLSLYNVLYIYLLIFCTVFHCSYLLLGGWPCSRIGFKWIHSLEGTFLLCHLIVTFMLILYYYPYFDTYV